MTCSVERIQEVHLGMVTLEGKVAEEVGQEDKVAVDVNEGELMMFDG